MVTQAEFYSSKRKEPEFHCITLTHSAFDAPYRLVFNQFQTVNLNGNDYIPVYGAITLTDSDAENPAVTISFPRIVVGREFDKQKKKIAESGRMEPIQVKYEKFIPSVQSAPVRTRTLYAVDSGGIVTNGETVSIKAGRVNKMTMDVADIYDVTVWTGLETV